MKISDILDKFSRTQKIIGICFAGVIVGLGLMFIYLLRAHTYLADDPGACVNCHIMSPYYATWMHSSHSRNATCNDCHVPHENIARKYAFKGMDGMKHVFAFVSKSERQSPKIGDEGAEVVMNNCIRCHEQLTTNLADLGKITYMQAKCGEDKCCWDCHRQVPHGGTNSLSRTPNAYTSIPNPPSPVPEWLQKIISK